MEGVDMRMIAGVVAGLFLTTLTSVILANPTYECTATHNNVPFVGTQFDKVASEYTCFYSNEAAYADSDFVEGTPISYSMNVSGDNCDYQFGIYTVDNTDSCISTNQNNCKVVCN